MPDADHDRLFDLIGECVMCHSPSGVEAEIDAFLTSKFQQLGLTAEQDDAGNLFVFIPGKSSACGTIAITAHKDEIGALVTRIEEDGRVRVRDRVGGAFPWVYGEGVVDFVGCETSGVLSFGSRHVSHASPQHIHKESSPLRWQDAWIETKLSAAELATRGVQPGTRMVIGKHRKAPFRMGEHIASYTLDNKASLAILLELAGQLSQPEMNLYLVASAKEEIGAIGALYFTQRRQIDAMVALEICPIAPEYPTLDTKAPVLLAEDSCASYDSLLNGAIMAAASECGIELQHASVNGFCSDGSHALKQGHIARAACLGFPTQNTHGYEIAPLAAIHNCVQVLQSFCERPLPFACESAGKAAGVTNPR